MNFIIKEILLSNYLLCIVLIFIISESIFSQEYDKIYLNNKEVYTGKVVRVTNDNIEIDLAEGSLKKIKKSEVKLIIYSDNEVFLIEDNLTGSESIDNTRFKGYRTDGYYITSYPIEYKYQFIKEKYRRTRSFQNLLLYIAFRIIPEDYPNENYNIQVAIFYIKKHEFLIRYSRKIQWKTIQDELLYKEKVSRALIEDRLNNKFDDLVWFKWKSNVFYIKLSDSDLTFYLSNFAGLKENIPRADILIGNYSSFSVRNFNRNENGLSEFNKFHKNVSNGTTTSFTIYKNQELYFVPDNKN